jgi:hypothetical protein
VETTVPSTATVQQEASKWSLAAITASPNRNRVIGIGIAATLVLAAIIYGVVRLLSPSASVTEVRFEIDPPNSILAIDGKAMPCAGVCTLKLAPGTHTTELTKSGYESQETSFDVKRQSEVLQGPHLVLKPTPTVTTAKVVSSSLAIVTDLASATVTLDGNPKGDLSSRRLDLNDLAPGSSHQIVLSDNGNALDLSVKISDQGALSVEGARGLDQNAVVALTPSRDGLAIFCRCKDAELRMDGKKLNPSGHDRYKLPTQGQPQYALTLVRGGKSESITLQAIDSKHAEIYIASPVQAGTPTPSPTIIASDNPVPPAPQSQTKPQPPPTSAPLVPPARTVDPAEPAWEKVNQQDVNALKDFLARYPNNQHAATAREKIEDIEWDQIKNSQNWEDFQPFLNAHSNGAHASEAKNRMVALKAAADDLDRRKREQQDRQDIKQTLEAYRSAYETKDLNKLIAIWPSIPVSVFKKEFQADKIRVTLDQKDPLITGDTATVDCRQKLEFVMSGKVSPPFDQTRRFTLRKLQGRWFIEKDN